MPNCNLHRPAGALVGAAAAFGLAAVENAERPWLEAGAGALGGWIGGALPDWIDPPTSPRHRGIGHGLLSAAPALVFLLVRLPRWQNSLRTAAATARQNAFAAGRASDWWATLLQAAAGFIAGVMAGYALHLIEDARTPSGLPAC